MSGASRALGGQMRPSEGRWGRRRAGGAVGGQAGLSLDSWKACSEAWDFCDPRVKHTAHK